MENKEYYTPQMSDLYFGYEYEIDEDWDILPNKQWHKQVYGINGTNPENLDYIHEGNLRKIRTPYLCKQDITDLGWEYHCQFEDKFSYYKVGGKGMYKNELHVNFNNQEIYIWNGANTIGFKGICKSKNELKKLMKDYLNIPIK